jgi:hypothetical protein
MGIVAKIRHLFLFLRCFGKLPISSISHYIKFFIEYRIFTLMKIIFTFIFSLAALTYFAFAQTCLKSTGEPV